MWSSPEPRPRYRGKRDDWAGFGLSHGLVGSLVITGLLLISALSTETRLGAPIYWSWVLTGLQVVALWAAGEGKDWGWLLGAGVQPPWILYAFVTGQIGFVPGCAVSASVQFHSFIRAKTRAGEPRRSPRSGRDIHLGVIT